MTFIQYSELTVQSSGKRAFTLAETMVVLVMIGIIAALTTPTLMKLIPNQNKIKFKKAYSNLENIISNMSNDEVDYPSTIMGTNLTNLASVPMGFQNTTAVTSPSSCNKFTYLFLQQANTIGPTKCDPPAKTTTKIGTTTDGIDWYIYLNALDSVPASSTSEFPIDFLTYKTKIIMDINGSALPNCTMDSNFSTYGLTQCAANTAADTFIIGVQYDGTLQVGCSTTPICKPGSGGSTDVTDQGAIDILTNPTNNK